MTSDAVSGMAFPEGLIDSKRRVFEEEARKLSAEAAREELRLATEQRIVNIDLASDRFYRVYHFDTAVTDISVKFCMAQLTEWHRMYPQSKIDVIFNSPGGDPISGFALFDYILHLKEEGHTITTTALGMAASMAGVLLQSGTTRVMGNDAWLLLHEGSFGAIGSLGAIEDQVIWIKKIQSRILDIFASRSIITREEIADRWERRDWWMSADEALEYGFIDRIGPS